ncbi:MAG: L-seryl-tRNA(Sec) selenium transferase [Candidatus Krumholzibacteria bacterium]|nr:L-seryl-tRNA(Sec) selenium transferase [Candidatus Krumholzibacteria bacterium]
MDIRESLKKLPSVERVLEDERIRARTGRLSRRGVIRLVRDRIDALREEVRSGAAEPPAEADEALGRIVGETVAEIDSIGGGRLRTVINATGVVLHTNLGRARLGRRAVEAISTAAARCTDLEIDLADGRRASRHRRVARLLRLLTGAGDALVVNNNAAAVLLAVDTLARSGAVAVSRGELVEIGGSFRLPEILGSAAGRVMEVGTTNRTHLGDYEKAIDDGATLLLKVHTSNYRVVGYTSEVPLGDLTALGARRGVPVMYDQGSGILFPLEEEGIEGEESIVPIIERGVDLLSCSADKVLGGPQAGLLLGRGDLIERMRANHLSRALRVDKLTLAGLEQALVHYWRGEFDELPSLGMILLPADGLRRRCEALAAELRSSAGAGARIDVEAGESSIGGGSFPSNPLPTALVKVTLQAGGPERLAQSLRRADPAVLVRVKGDAIYIDLRTVTEEEQPFLLERLAEGIGSHRGRK